MKAPYSLDESVDTQPTIGVVVLSTDETLEPEFRRIYSAQPSRIYHSRIPFDPVVTPDTLATMEAQLPASLALFSRHIDFDVIGYGCTSGATVIGSDKIEKIVHAQFPDAAVTDPIRSVIAACRALGVARMGMLTPYSLDVTQAMQARLEKSGIDVCSFASFNETYDHRVARITEQSVLDAIVKLNTDECDIIFASCTSLRCFNIIETAEEQLNKPVISSNSAFAWHLHGLAGAAEGLSGPGQLFRQVLGSGL